MSETRGQAARRRRNELGLTREQLAVEAKVSTTTLQTYEEDRRPNMTKEPQILAALDRLEAERATQQQPTQLHPGRREILDRMMSGMEIADIRLVPVEIEGVLYFTATLRTEGVSDEDARQAVRDYMKRNRGDQ